MVPGPMLLLLASFAAAQSAPAPTAPPAVVTPTAPIAPAISVTKNGTLNGDGVAGDTVGFQFDGVPGGRAFAIKPAASGVATNITVYTNRRSYYFHVVEARETPHYVVQFRYPDANVQPARAVAADAPNANYAVSATEEFTPTAIWDDGTFTYFRFARNAPVPAIFRYANGGERAVNSTALEDGVIRVSGVNRQWVLRLGEDEVCVQDMGRGATS